jgi:hypothetical protein
VDHHNYSPEMSWSLPFNGKRSILRDSYHRLAITVQINDVTGKEFLQYIKELAQSNLLHINVLIPHDYSKIIAANFVVERLQSLVSLGAEINDYYRPSENGKQTARKFFVSVQFRHDMFPLAKALLASGCDADLWLLDISGQKCESLQNVHEISRLIAESNKEISLGISHCENPMELDWFLSKIQKDVLSVVHIGEIILPNLLIHSIELVHTAGYTAMVKINSSSLESEIAPSVQLNELADKYKVPPEIFLVKILLQLGCVVSLPFKFCQLSSQQQLTESIARLAHPFVHRKPFVSMFKMVSLSVLPEDIQLLIEESEAEEAKTDSYWSGHATDRSEPRTLTYQK